MRFEERFFEDIQVGETRTTLGRTVTEADIVLHAGQTGDFYPHHMDAEWTRSQPFGQRIAHGTLIISISVGMSAGDINPRAFSYGYERIRFVKPVHIGDTITAETRIEAKRDDPRRPCYGFVNELVSVRNQNGKTVLVLTHVHLVERREAWALEHE